MPGILRAAVLALLISGAALAQEAYDGVSRRTEAPDASVPVMTRPPELVRQVEPKFPSAARKDELSGEVVLKLTLDAEGTVEQAEVIKGAGNGFDEAALDAVVQFVFRPAEIDGKPGSVQIEFTQHFVWRAQVVVDAGVAEPLGGVLAGQLLEKGSRHPVSGCTVWVSGGKNSFESDAEGRFTLTAGAGPVTVYARGSSHEPFEAEETPKAGERLEVIYYLTPKAIGLYQTTVHGERERTEVSRHTLQREELQKVPGAFGDPLRVLQTLPGVARAPFGLGLLLVRGSSPNDTGVYFDGIQLPLLYHFGGGPSVVNPELVDRIDFYPGGFGSEYGRAIGGIVDVGPRDLALDGLVHVSGKVDLIDAALYVSAPIPWVPGLSFSVSGRRSYVDALLALVLQGTTLIAPSYYDWQAKVDYHPPGSQHSFGLFVFGSDDLLKVVMGRGSPTSLELNTQQGFVRVEGAWAFRGEKFVNKVQLFGGINSQSFGIASLRFDENDVVGGLRERAEYAFNEHVKLRGGLDIQLTQATLSTYLPMPPDYPTFPGEQPDIILVTNTQHRDVFPYAEWLELQLKAGPFKIFPGLRAEQYRELGNWRVDLDPRLAVRLEFGEEGHRLSVKGSVGLYHENATVQLLTANPKLDLQAAFQTSLGAEYDLTPDINIDVTGFYNRRFNLAERANLVTVDKGIVTRVLADNGAVGRAYGVELFIRRKITEHFFGWLTYTLSWSQTHNREAAYQWAQFDQRHILNLVAQYKFNNGWEIGARFRLTTGNPTTPVIGSTFDSDSQSYRPINGPSGSTRDPTFHQLDVRVDKTWLFKKWTLGIYVDIQNIYNASNQEAVLNDYRYRTTAAINGLPIIPVLGIKGNY